MLSLSRNVRKLTLLVCCVFWLFLLARRGVSGRAGWSDDAAGGL